MILGPILTLYIIISVSNFLTLVKDTLAAHYETFIYFLFASLLELDFMIVAHAWGVRGDVFYPTIRQVLFSSNINPSTLVQKNITLKFELS